MNATGGFGGRRGIHGRFFRFILAAFAVLILGPFLVSGLGSWLGARFTGIFFREEVSSREEELRNSLVMLMVENSILREEKMKADRYRMLLGISRVEDRKAVPARVLYRSEGMVTGTMVLDRGREHGIVENSVCISAEGLVGVVSRAWESTSEILPITNPSVNVSCVTWPSNAYGILQSSSNGSLEMVHVDLAQEVAVGDMVFTSRFGGVFPDGLLVGTVTGVMPGEPGLAMRLSVEPAADFRSTGEVLILLPRDGSGNRVP